MPDNYVDKLSKFTSCDVADGLQNLYNIKDGGFFPNLCQRSCNDMVGSVVGRAYTVLFTSSTNKGPSINYIDSIPNDSILVMAYTPDLQLPVAPYTSVNNAIFGGLMATRAKYQGVNGTVVFGRVRDIDEFKSLEYPVFSYGVSASASKGTVKPVQVNTTLSVVIASNTDSNNILNIQNNDYIVCDQHGMVRIPHEDVNMDDLVKYIETSVEVDKLVAKDIEKGKAAEESKNIHRKKLGTWKC